MWWKDTDATDGDIKKRVWRGSSAFSRWCYKAGTAVLFFRIELEVQAENLQENVPCNGKGHSCDYYQTADRLHNMRTLQFMRPEKQKKKQGNHGHLCADCAATWIISRLKTELDDLALKYSQPGIL